jgi:hypothetical protein
MRASGRKERTDEEKRVDDRVAKAASDPPRWQLTLIAVVGVV